MLGSISNVYTHLATHLLNWVCLTILCLHHHGFFKLFKILYPVEQINPRLLSYMSGAAIRNA